MMTHVVPCPPSAGNEHRIFKLLRWLRDEGYEVVLVLRASSRQAIDARRVAALRDLVYRLHVVRPPRPGWRMPWTRLESRARWLWRRMFDEAYNLLGGRYYTRHVRPWLMAVVNAVVAAPRPERAPGGRARQVPAQIAPQVPAQVAPPVPSRAIRIEDEICPTWFVEAAARLCADYGPAAVMAQYIWMSRCLQRLPPETLKLIDCHDLFSARAEKVQAHGIDDDLSISGAEEVERLVRADVVMAIQDEERQALEAMGLDRRIITVGVDFEEQPARRAPVRGRILCVAADNAPNVEGLRAFLDQAWPRVLAASPEATLHLVGGATRRLRTYERTTLTRYLPDLGEAYADAEVVINPVIAGTGLKIKTVEALAYGRPLVAWPNGVSGLDGSAGLPCLVASDWGDFADKVVRLLGDAALRQQIADQARRYVRVQFHRERVYAALGAALTGGRVALSAGRSAAAST